MNYYGFVYKWIDATNGRTYIGSHKGKIEDKYYGSGVLFKPAFQKRKDEFAREILEYVYGDKKNLLEVEQKYLNKIDWDNTYNLSNIAGGGNMRSNFTKEQLIEYNQKQSDRKKGNVYGRGNKGKPGPKGFLGRTHSEESKQKISENCKGRVAWNKGLEK